VEEKVLIVKGDEITALYSDDVRELGTSLFVARASDVEWDNEAQGWFATIRPRYVACDCGSDMPHVHHQLCARLKPNGVTLLGPFPTRDEALRAEVAFIQARL
jgi:hypothetical protein